MGIFKRKKKQSDGVVVVVRLDRTVKPNKASLNVLYPIGKVDMRDVEEALTAGLAVANGWIRQRATES